MPKDKASQGIVLDKTGQEQPADKERAQTAQETEPGHMRSQAVIKDETEKNGVKTSRDLPATKPRKDEKQDTREAIIEDADKTERNATTSRNE